MAQHNPLYPGTQTHDDDQSVLKPPSSPADSKAKTNDTEHSDEAVALIRQKLASIYGNEPDAKQELAEAELPGLVHSKHQHFMSGLHASGKPMAQIQAEWHQYYQSLDDTGKHEVWQEFYSQSAQANQQPSRLEPTYQHRFDDQQAYVRREVDQPSTAASSRQPSTHPASSSPRLEPSTIYPTASSNPLYPAAAEVAPIEPAAPSTPVESVQSANIPSGPVVQPADIKRQLLQTVGSRGKLQAKHHLQSLLFGLGFGGLVLLIVLFSFFNEVVVAPFIQPSRTVSATPIIVSPDGVTANGKNEVIIPKINVEIPLELSSTTIDEKAFEAALDNGVAHYPTTALPGQKGNTSFFGHSSNNIFNPGKYKFAFVLLNELVPGDTFYLTYNGVAYAYQVYDKKIVEASDVAILNPVADKASTAMLVTCDPPGTSLRRLAVWGEQVSPNPNSNVAATTQTTGTQPATASLPGNGPTLWGRIRNWVTGG